MKKILFPITCLIAIFFGCRSSQDIHTVPLSATQQIVFLDSVQATTAITIDNAEGFFGQIGKLDMEIQLQRNFPANTPRDSVLREYREFLRREVTDFTTEDMQILTETWQEAYRRASAVSPDLFPPKIQLIKTIGRHYGPGVYYTREDNIVIPASELLDPTIDNLLPVMLHELFHIYSRNHPEKRAALYRLIGFETLGTFPSDLDMDEGLRERVLINPDGINYAVGIRLQTAEGEQMAIPLLKSVTSTYEPEKASYFNHLNFSIYPVEAISGGRFQVISEADGNSPLNLQEEQDFFRQIKDNTDYIIHPDEIMADNFVWMILSGSGKIEYQTERLSEEGKQLLADTEQILNGQATGQ